MRNWLIVTLLTTLALPLMAETESITNGGFEQLGSNYFPVDWGPVGPGVTVSPQAHTGKYSLRIERARRTPMPPETGLNRAWSPGAGTGGSMLSVRKGVVRVWYRVLSAEPGADMAVVVIPMGASGVEDTGESRTRRTIPNDAAGDGEWHETKLAYDYTAAPAVKWVHVGIRIVGGAADLLVDDFELLQGEMSVLQVEKVHVYPDATTPDRLASLQACIANVGSAPSGPIRVVVEAPTGMVAEGPVTAGPLHPSGASTLRWRLRGRMTPATVRIHAEDPAGRDTARALLRPRLEMVSALAAPSLAAPGEKVEITATVWNRGTAIAEGYSVQLQSPSGKSGQKLALPAVAPGRKAQVRFRLPATGSPGTTVAYRCVLDGPTDSATARSWPVTVATTDALRGKATLALGPLVLRTGSDRTIAEVLYVHGKTAVLAGTMPHLGRVSVRLPSGRWQTLTARYPLVSQGSKGIVNLACIERDAAGARWTFGARLEPLAAGAVRVGVSVRCSADRQIGWFEGPMLLAGERAGGARKLEAIFPGLEWLTQDEVSSNDLDIITEHADRPRYAPHPHKVTIPAMVVTTPVATTALFWDARSRWDGTHDRPQPVFASPDRVGGRAAHLMGLVAPSSAHGWPENAIVESSGKTWTLKAGRTLVLTAVVRVLSPNGTPTKPRSLAGVADWFRWYSPEKPAPAPQGTDLGQIAWSMHAYMDLLWDREGRGWLPYLNGPAIWRKPSYDPGFAYDLLEATRLLPGDPRAQGWRERLEFVRSRGAVHTQDEFSFAEGDPLTNLRAQSWSLSAIAGQQAPDGSYAFDADRRDQGIFAGYDYHELGKPGEVEIGLIARNAYLLLRMARITGDRQLWETGLRSLRRMRDFEVPRAAQVWEVPVHTPDILAAADAVEAYLEAYRFSGEKQWLTEARRWAMAGLPFVYVWNAPGKLWMRWGSIPVFGASQTRWSWFGNIVQWNGLRHAAALLKLHPYDPETRFGGLSWRDIAVGITRSAMYQQSLKPEILTLWPDSYHTITDVRASWDFAPRLILKNVFAMLGRSEEPDTVRVAGPNGAVARVTSLGTVSRAGWNAATISFTVDHPTRMRGSVVVAGITRPTAVRVGASRVPERADGLGPEEAGWRYDGVIRAVAIRIPHDAPASVVIEGVQPARSAITPARAERLLFNFDAEEEGWSAEHDATLSAKDGCLQGVSLGADPFLVRSNCRFDGSAVQNVVLRIKADGNGNGQFYWTTTDEASFDEAKVLSFTFPADGEWHEVIIPVGSHDRWRGKTITAIRIDPVNAPGVSFAIDRIEGK